MQGISSATPTHRFEKLPCCTLALHILCTNTEAHWVLQGVPREGAGWMHPQRRETGDVLFQFMLGPVGGLCAAEQTSSAGASHEGIGLGRFSAGEGVVRVGIFREQWSLKHCTDWGSFETFPCPQKGDPPLKHLQALGSPPGTISKTFSSSCCLCTCLPPVALTWQCLKLLPLVSPPTSASDVLSLLDAGEDGPARPRALRGALSSHGSSQSREICQCSLCPGAGGALELQSPPQDTAKSPCGQWLLPSCTARGNPLRALHREMRIRPRVFLLGFYSCAVPTARLVGSSVDIFQGAQNSTDLFSRRVRLPVSRGNAFRSLPDFSALWVRELDTVVSVRWGMFSV